MNTLLAARTLQILWLCRMTTLLLTLVSQLTVCLSSAPANKRALECQSTNMQRNQRFFLEPIIKILDAQKAKKNERAVYGLLHPNVPIMNSWMRSRGLWVGKASWPYKNWPTYISGPCTFMDKEAALGNELNFNLKWLFLITKRASANLLLTRQKAIADAAETALEVFNVPIEDALFTGILRVKGCVEIRNGRTMCHHLQSNIQSTLKMFLNSFRGSGLILTPNFSNSNLELKELTGYHENDSSWPFFKTVNNN